MDVIRHLKKRKKISDSFYEKFRLPEGSSKPALFYGGIKLHKEGEPLRTVVTPRWVHIRPGLKSA